MTDAHWEALKGSELRYRDNTWELTGDVEIRDQGAHLAVKARQVDEVRHGPARLHFTIDDPPDSINPGALGEHFDSIERTKRANHLIIKTAGRTYRYTLRRISIG